MTAGISLFIVATAKHKFMSETACNSTSSTGHYLLIWPLKFSLNR